MKEIAAVGGQSISPWRALECVPGLCAVPAIWRSLLADHFLPFRSAFLRSRLDRLARSVPCPTGCGTWHQVVHHGANDIVGVSRCEASNCDDLTLSRADIIPLELNWTRLASAVCLALGCDARRAGLDLPATAQIGAWSADAVPVILSVQNRRSQFRFVVTSLVARLRRPFILLTPTSQHLDAHGTELLSGCKAACFAIESVLRLTDQGTLQPLTTPGLLFAEFTPQPKETEQNVAQRAFALVRQLDSGELRKPPTALTVFRLYCVEALSAQGIARRFGWSRTTVLRRLQLIRAKTGVDPDYLRTLSPHLSRLEADLSDSRARHIHPYRLIEDDGPEGDQS